MPKIPDLLAVFAPEALAEAPLIGMVGGRVISGQVDRLLVRPEAVLVLDFKTNRPPPDTLAGVAPLYLRQMAAYRAVLRRLYPEALSWYQPLNLTALQPGLMNWLYMLFMEFSIKQWAAIRNNDLLATLTWMPQGGRTEALYGASAGRVGGNRPPYRDQGSEAEALTQLLIHVRRALSNRATLSLDYPAYEMADAILAAGFKPRRTLIWMRA